MRMPEYKIQEMLDSIYVNLKAYEKALATVENPFPVVTIVTPSWCLDAVTEVFGKSHIVIPMPTFANQFCTYFMNEKAQVVTSCFPLKETIVDGDKQMVGEHSFDTPINQIMGLDVAKNEDHAVSTLFRKMADGFKVVGQRVLASIKPKPTDSYIQIDIDKRKLITVKAVLGEVEIVYEEPHLPWTQYSLSKKQYYRQKRLQRIYLRTKNKRIRDKTLKTLNCIGWVD